MAYPENKFHHEKSPFFDQTDRSPIHIRLLQHKKTKRIFMHKIT